VEADSLAHQALLLQLNLAVVTAVVPLVVVEPQAAAGVELATPVNPSPLHVENHTVLDLAVDATAAQAAPMEAAHVAAVVVVAFEVGVEIHEVQIDIEILADHRRVEIPVIVDLHVEVVVGVEVVVEAAGVELEVGVIEVVVEDENLHRRKKLS